MIKSIFESQLGCIIISLILGLGLAALFKKVCKGDCVVIKAPNTSDVKNYYYKIDDDCYKYEPEVTTCVDKKE